MAKTDAPQPDLTSIGEVATPAVRPSARPADALPRAAPRGSAIWPRATISRPICSSSPASPTRSTASQDGLPAPALPEPDALDRAREFGMPPLDRTRFAPGRGLRADARRVCSPLAADLEMPDAARGGAGRGCAAADAGGARRDGSRTCWPTPSRSKRSPSISSSPRRCRSISPGWPRVLDAKALVPVGDGACPVCGGPPASLDGGRLARRPRRALLRLRAVRHAVELRAHQVHALRLDRGHLLSGARRRRGHGEGRDLRELPRLRQDPATSTRTRPSTSSPTTSRALGLDLLVRETGFQRGGANPFLVGY